MITGYRHPSPRDPDEDWHPTRVLISRDAASSCSGTRWSIGSRRTRPRLRRSTHRCT